MTKRRQGKELLKEISWLAGAALVVCLLVVGSVMRLDHSRMGVAALEQENQDKREALQRGFGVVESGPLVRSSYHADEQARRGNVTK